MASLLQWSLVIRDMPSCMNYVLQSIAEKCIYCSFCHQFLLNNLGKLSKWHSISHLVQRFGNDGGIYVVYYQEYICLALAMFDLWLDQLPLSWDDYVEMFDNCKHMTFLRAMQVHKSEGYLGNISFGDELHLSVGDLLTRVRTVFGFWPFRIGKKRPALSPN